MMNNISIHDTFLQACKDNDVSLIKLALEQGSDINLLYCDQNIPKGKQNQKYITIKAIQNIVTAAVFYRRLPALLFISQQAKDNSFIAKSLFSKNKKLNEYQRHEYLFDNLERAIRVSHIELLHCLLNDFPWQYSKKELYQHVFCVAACFNSLAVLDYVWQQGYSFTQRNVSINGNSFSTIYTLAKSETLAYINKFISTKKLAQQLEQNLSSQDEVIRPKL